jgi:acyl-CoA thioester hydrolase
LEQFYNSKIRVRYGETDQMGVVYHGNYAQYLEIGRIELLRSLGISYKKMEEEGIILPVVSISLKFMKSAVYDEVINVRTQLNKIPTATLDFDYKITNEKGELLSTANTVLVFVDKSTKRPTRCPQYILDKLQN